MGMYFVKDWYCQKKGAKVVSFSDGTDAEIAAMLQSYYNNELTWQEMGWAVGDTRKIHLNSFYCPNPHSSYYVDAQEITCVIVAHDHTPLATSINEHTNACITVQFRETLGVGNTLNDGKDGTIYLNGSTSSASSFVKWSNLYTRTYINSTLLGVFSYSTDKGSGTSFKDMIKPSKHYRHTTYSSSTSEEVTDTLFLPSYPEIFGTESYNRYSVTDPAEGTQFAYYNNAPSNVLKYSNNNGVASSYIASWWTGSAAFYYSSGSYRWVVINSQGEHAMTSYGNARALAPAWAM